MPITNIPREKIPWYPTINEEACIGDRNCVDFCKNEVFEWDEENGKPMVVKPFNCILGCSACAQICPADAINFPSLEELRRVIKSLREEAEQV
ncbi:MAG: 4Fe-4S dicluster domain-containing protein [Candidatus Aminicenantia bacterium]